MMSSEALMSKKHRSQINIHRIELMNTIDFEHSMLWDYLISYGVINSHQRESITARFRANHEQVMAFLDYLEKRPDCDFDKFCRALIDSEQEHVVTLLDS